MTLSIAVATCAELPDGDEDGRLLVDALRHGGADARWQVWNDASVDWASFDRVVIRSTWDYTLQRDTFLGWARSLSRLDNPAPVVEWNSDKTYLRDLAAAGLPVVPTTWAAAGEPIVLPEIEYVVKPSVGAGSLGAGRFHPADPGSAAAAHAHAAALHRSGRTVMVQPYLAEVDDAGETALVYLDGRFSHAIRKGPMLGAGTVHPLTDGYSGALFVGESITPRTPSPAELAVGQRAVDHVRERFGRDLLYARVDLLPGPDGPVIIELELTEPSLFLEHDPDAPERAAAAVLRRAG